VAAASIDRSTFWIDVRRQRYRKLALLLVALLLIDLLAVLAWSTAAKLAVPDRRDGAAIGILWGDNEKLAAETLRRARHAYMLWSQGPSSRIIICVGGRRHSTDFNGAEQVCNLLRQMGVPPDRLEVGTGSNDTISNLRDLAESAKRRGVSSVTAVAGPLQALRASTMLAHQGITLYWSTYPIRKVPPIKLWRMAHHEWFALVTMALPESLRQYLLARTRP
jgi:uncharacterized SAM-binding protein YcdF (DUF218 family)